MKDKQIEQKEIEDKEEIEIIINRERFIAEKKVFKTGRKGYGLYGRILIKKYPHRISMNIIEM